jgi:hypothetical protein
MRENRPYGSEGGVAMSHPDPYRRRLVDDGAKSIQLLCGVFLAGQARRMRGHSSFDVDTVPDRKRTTLDDTGRDAATPVGRQRFQEAGMSLLHAAAGIGLRRDFQEDGPDPDETAGAAWQRNAFDQKIGPAHRPGQRDGAGEIGQLGQRPMPILQTQDRDLPARELEAFVVAVQTAVHGDASLWDLLHPRPWGFAASDGQQRSPTDFNRHRWSHRCSQSANRKDMSGTPMSAACPQTIMTP